MNLPELELQILYGRLSWGVVLAAVAVWAATWRGTLPRGGWAAIALAVAALPWLPAPWSPAYWLGLAFQAPSGLTTALCAAFLYGRWTGHAGGGTLAPPVAAMLALAGALLYLDASGWIAQGLYFMGFGPLGAPAAALAIGACCAAAVVRGAAVRTAWAVLAAVALFMLLRLPTGNLWDAVLDPFLWVAALAVCWRAWRGRRKRKMEWIGDLR